AFFNEVFRCTEREAAFGSEVRSVREVCGKAARFGTRMRNTLLHFALKVQNFTSPQAILLTAHEVACADKE
ncbi:MAG: hypothetical protein Q4C01_07855, partial [Clostridia bacterium]|nr:hypothetical protein [Clostridia bacterium]